jgi:hypothetical protein
MFEMKIEKQLNIKDRTLLLGQPNESDIPEVVSVDGHTFKVLGRSLGVQPPFVSLEIEKTNIDFIGKTIK